MYAIGYMPDEYIGAYEVCKEIHYKVLDKVLTGAKGSEIFDYSKQLAQDAGYGDYFLGYDQYKVSFLAHGIGIELAELPFIATKQDYSLEAGMTFAVEPKMVFPKKGACGIENTVLLEHGGYRVLTDIDEQIIVV
jgi:Xaa-Pro aminopeptidase